ncbi:MAG: glycosyltransferase family 39 protein [Actinomycetota bacterium]
MQQILPRFSRIPQSLKADTPHLLAIVAIWAMMVALVNPIGDFPLNDDWAFGRSVQHFLATGQLKIADWGAMNQLIHLLWGALFCLIFGFSFTTLRFSILILGLIGVIVTYGILREANLSRKVALLGALSLALNPVYFKLSNSFMTDVSFFTFSAFAFYFLVRSLKRDSWLEMIAGLSFATCALLIRQLGLAIFIGFSCAYVAKKGWSLQNICKGLSASFLGFALQLFYREWLVMTNNLPANYNLQTQEILKAFAQGLGAIFLKISHNFMIAFLTLGLLTLPLMAILLINQLPSLSRREKMLSLGFIGGFSMVSVVAFLLNRKTIYFWEVSSLGQFGLSPLLLRDYWRLSTVLNQINLAGKIYGILLPIIGIFGASFLVYYCLLISRKIWFSESLFYEREDRWLLVFAMSATISYCLPLLLLERLMDRYLFFVIPLVFVAIGLSTPPLQKGNFTVFSTFICSLILLLYGISAVVFTHDYLSLNRTQWAATSNLVQELKVPPNQIDGGFEFNGWYLYDANYQEKPNKSWWWVDRDDYVISLIPIGGYEEIKSYPIKKMLPLEPKNVLILRKTE